MNDVLIAGGSTSLLRRICEECVLGVRAGSQPSPRVGADVLVKVWFESSPTVFSFAHSFHRCHCITAHRSSSAHTAAPQLSA